MKRVSEAAVRSLLAQALREQGVTVFAPGVDGLVLEAGLLARRLPAGRPADLLRAARTLVDRSAFVDGVDAGALAVEIEEILDSGESGRLVAWTESLDALSAGLTWLERPGRVEPVCDLVLALIRAFPEDWEPVRPAAKERLNRLPPVAGDPMGPILREIVGLPCTQPRGRRPQETNGRDLLTRLQESLHPVDPPQE